jgi:hypothetical protein
VDPDGKEDDAEAWVSFVVWMLRARTQKPRRTTLLREAKIDEKAKTLTLVLDLQEPTPSASGKTLVVATTHGNQPTDVTVNGKPVIVGVNAYIRNR